MTDEEKKAASPHAVLEETGVAFDPSTQHLDLTKDEKRRTTALMMAIQAYQNLIIKDADYLREAHEQARRNDGPAIRPATMDAMVEAAIKFDLFISGNASLALPCPTLGGSQTEDPADNPARETNCGLLQRGSAMTETRAVHDPFLGKTVEVSDRLTDRLRGRYAVGSTLSNGEPEFGWLEHETTPIQRDAADEIDRLRGVILNIQALAETGNPIDTHKLATRCRRALAQ